MDEDKLHKQLNDRIKDVFDNYEDTGADESWAALRQKFPVEKKDRGFAWLWYAAAAIVLLGIGLWFMQPADQQQQFVHQDKPAVKPAETKDSRLSDSIAIVPQPTIVTPSAPLSPGQQIATNKTQAPVRQQRIAATTPSVQVASAKVNNPVTGGTQRSAVPNVISQTAPPDVKPVAEQYAATATAKADNTKEYVKADSNAVSNTRIIAQNNTPAKPAATNSAEAMLRMLSEKLPEDNRPKTKKTDKRAIIGVYAGTFFNYADGSENKVNVGAGVTTDLSITRNLKLSTGVSIAQNSLNYNYDVYKGSELYAAALDMRSSSNAYGPALSYTAPIPKNYRASLIGLDIPLNLKYQFDGKKSDAFVSAGVSSGTFLNETYVLDYSVGNTKEQTTTQSKFSDFYLAKTLNVSFGVGYPLGKSNRLVIEPFLKYPLGGMGTQQIKFGSGGVNLKLNFSTGKN